MGIDQRLPHVLRVLREQLVAHLAEGRAHLLDLLQLNPVRRPFRLDVDAATSCQRTRLVYVRSVSGRPVTVVA